MNRFVPGLGLTLLCLVLSPTLVFAQERSVPPEGIAAEMENRWDDAITIYQRATTADPGRADLWARIADIHSAQKRPHDAETALQAAVRIEPDHAGYWFRLSRTRAVLGQPAPALEACRAALRLAPDDLEVLRTCARQAVWADELPLAKTLYGDLLRRVPGDTAAQLALTRIAAWAGQLERAVEGYQAYLEQDPTDPKVWLEYAQTQTWRGNFIAAENALTEYESRFGTTTELLKTRARLLARADFGAAAMRINRDLLDESPRDYEINYTRTIALRAHRQPSEAIASLATLESLRPGSVDNEAVRRFVEMPLRSFLRAQIGYRNDSDEIDRYESEIDLLLPFNGKRTALMAGAGRQRLSAPTGSGLERIDGQEQAHFDLSWIGLRHRFSPAFELRGSLGTWDIRDGGSHGTHRLIADLDLGDHLNLQLETARQPWDVSPRTVSLEIRESGERASFRWRPDLAWIADGMVRRTRLSDGNGRSQADLALRRAVKRTQRYNLDLGIAAEWLAFDHDLDQGYYDPDNYRRYAMTAYSYWKHSDDIGISASISLGWHRDERMSGWKFGEDLVVDGFFGIYQDWLLRVRGGYSERYQESGAYDGAFVRLALSRRF
ncbi:MAG: tetratricopeptide repeat protein [Gammaproteobacteria bacterium]|nr:tetratricopeptide repeat protein [Gammaproteobacteria bacterium]